ncbi:hypothetical protein BJ138DRAFT_1145935 [Hygrophoropsis aurantiaca]|uniref:Uncharacterized protein n=1 Tax=Hygrophoropsis aurantiaca TaxID=72124 RepID=A0ACB8ALA7_9AGAM|nr:hypothetical protein BJ138DRAFT_1145935 [Hygrophoropsis aurantiaca]
MSLQTWSETTLAPVHDASNPILGAERDSDCRALRASDERSQPQPIKVGIVGLSTKPGTWARTFLFPALNNAALASTYSITALSTTTPASACASVAEFSPQLNANVDNNSPDTHAIRPYSGDTAQIAADPDVDLVVVSVKAPHQKATAMPVIAAGKHCFIEWPVGKNSRETVELAEAARAQGVRNIVGLQGRHSVVLRKARDIIAAGKIGKVLSCSVISLIPREAGYCGPFVNEINAYTIDEASGGSTLDIIVAHHLDSLLSVLGQDFVSVSATKSILYPTASLIDMSGRPTGTSVTVTCPDQVAFTGTLSGGAVASVIFRGGYTAVQRGDGPEKGKPFGRKNLLWEIDGEDGCLRIESGTMWGSFLQMADPTLFLNGEQIQVQAHRPEDAPIANAIAKNAENENGTGNSETGTGSARKEGGKTILNAEDLLVDCGDASLRNLVTQFAEFAKDRQEGSNGEDEERRYATLDDAVKLRRLLDAISTSAKEGRRVDL